MELDGLWEGIRGNWNKDALAALNAAGVSLAALLAAEDRTGIFPVTVARARRRTDGGFDFDETGREVFIACDSNGADVVLDMVAFTLEAPHRPASYNGMCRVLNESYCFGQSLFASDVRLFSDPLKWLIAGGDGGVVIQWDQPPWLMPEGRLVCDTPALARRVKRLYEAPPRIPSIFVEQPALAVAA